MTSFRDWTPAKAADHNAKVVRDAQAARIKTGSTRTIAPGPAVSGEVSGMPTVQNAHSCAQEPAVAVLEPKSTTSTHEDHIDPEIPNAKQRKRKAPLAVRSERKAQGATGVLGSAGDRRPQVRFTLWRVRLLDCDAAYASVKSILDCCWLSKIVDGDRPDQITLEVNQTRVASFKEEKTVIEIEFPD